METMKLHWPREAEAIGFILQGKTQTEMARHWGISRTNCYQVIHRARAHLGECLRQLSEEDPANVLNRSGGLDIEP